MGLGKTVMLIALHLHRAEHGTRRADARRLPGVGAGQLGARDPALRPGRPTSAATTAPAAASTARRTGSSSPPTPPCGATRSSSPRTSPGWGLVVADEAQNVKNVRAGAARALRTIPGEAKLALTGTPVENNLAELWAIVDWTTPGLLGSYEQFRRRWSRPIESRRDTGARQRPGPADPAVRAPPPQERPRHRAGAAARRPRPTTASTSPASRSASTRRSSARRSPRSSRPRACCAAASW